MLMIWTLINNIGRRLQEWSDKHIERYEKPRYFPDMIKDTYNLRQPQITAGIKESNESK